jgi:hypothetical protein
MMNKKIIKKRIKKIQMIIVKKENSNEKLKILLHSMHGLVLIVTIITPKIHFLDIDASVADLKNLNFSLCNFLTLAENIVII